MNKMYGWLVLVLFVAWSALSWRWYTCDIKGFCGDSNKEIFSFNNTQDDLVVPVERDSSIDVLIPAQGEVIEVIQNEEEVLVEVVPQEQVPVVCNDLLTTNIGPGDSNDASEVSELQSFLNDREGENLTVDGLYSDDDVEAVNRFQLKYSADILDPLNLPGPTGNVYGSTRAHVNELFCNN